MNAVRGSVSLVAAISIVLAAAHPQAKLRHTAPVFEFGGDSAPPEYTFTSTPSLVVARDGSIYARVMDDATVMSYRPDGTFIRSIGRHGEGPGEFQFAVSHGLLGDTLWIADLVPRVSRMMTNGKHIRTSTVGFPPAPGLSMQTGITALLRNGWAAGILARKRNGACETGDRPVVVAKLPLLLHPDTIALLPAQGLNIPCIGDWTYRAIAHSPSIAFAGDGSAIGILSWSDTDPGAFTIRVLAPDGTERWHRTMRVARAVEVPRSVRDSIVEEITAKAKPQIDAALRDHRVTGTPKSLVEKGLDIPRYYPPVRRILMGVDGTTWVEQSLDLQGGTWIVLDAKGQTLFRVLVPLDIVVQQASRTDIWGVQTDSLGIASMLKRHIVD
jgi:hypothetical protein